MSFINLIIHYITHDLIDLLRLLLVTWINKFFILSQAKERLMYISIFKRILQYLIDNQ